MNSFRMIYWLTQTLADHPALARAEAPAGLLSHSEREQCRSLAIEKRRRDWLLGRWTAKHLVAHYIESAIGCRPALSDIIISPDPDGAPRVRIAGDFPLSDALSLSISHSHHRSCCSLTAQPGWTAGIDLEFIEPREPAFVSEYFGDAEMELVARAPQPEQPLLITAIWSAKEAALKALRRGLTVDTRSIICLPETPKAAEWTPIRMTSQLTDDSLQGWWRVMDGFTVSMAVVGVAESDDAGGQSFIRHSSV